jgi:ABC-type nitrate/sulfonate/bicarbonate transport system permease component
VLVAEGRDHAPPGPSRSRSAGRRPDALRPAVDKVVAVVAVIAAWQLASWAGVIDTRSIASPAQIVGELAGFPGDPAFWPALGATLQGWAIGLVLSVAIALPVGLALGSSEIAYRSCRFTIDFVRTIPPVALVPLALLIYGATLEMKVVLVVLGACWPVLLQTMSGVHQVDPVSRETARSYRLDRARTIVWVVVPGASPFIATGVRIAATMALILTIGSELIGGAPGLGQQIGLAEVATDVSRMYALIVVCAALGVLVNAVLARAEGRVMSWHVSQTMRTRAHSA